MRGGGPPDGLPPALHDGHLLAALQQLTLLQLLDRPAHASGRPWLESLKAAAINTCRDVREQQPGAASLKFDSVRGHDRTNRV